MTDRLRSEMSRTPDLNARGIDFGPAARSESYLRMVARQFMHHRAAVLGMAVIVLFFLTALLAPYIAPYDPAAIDLANRLQGPSAGHWLGTDELGRDVFSRIIIGARITLIITMGAVGLALFTGTVFGLIAGFYGGPTDTLISRSIDVLERLTKLLLEDVPADQGTTQR